MAIDPYGHCGFSGLVALHPYAYLVLRSRRSTGLCCGAAKLTAMAEAGSQIRPARFRCQGA